MLNIHKDSSMLITSIMSCLWWCQKKCLGGNALQGDLSLFHTLVAPYRQKKGILVYCCCSLSYFTLAKQRKLSPASLCPYTHQAGVLESAKWRQHRLWFPQCQLDVCKDAWGQIVFPLLLPHLADQWQINPIILPLYFHTKCCATLPGLGLHLWWGNLKSRLKSDYFYR